MSEMKKRWDSVPNWAKYTLYTILDWAAQCCWACSFGNVVMWLWNWLMPKLFGLGTIGFWRRSASSRWRASFLVSAAPGIRTTAAPSSAKRKSAEQRRRSGRGRQGWEYYDDWWDEDGKAAFRAYAERMKKDAGQQSAPKSGEA
jgi:hypothetical protein